MKMTSLGFAFFFLLFVTISFPASVIADEQPADPAFKLNLPAIDNPTGEKNAAGDTINQTIDTVKEKTGEYADKVNQSEQAKKYSAGILEPIYSLAEYLSFSSFHWVAFMIMVSGVVSFALQLVLAKLAVLFQGGLSITQFLTDAQGLIISVVGLFLTTQAAAENSSFTSSPAAVLSATIVGAVIGFMFYLWSQSQELEALKGRREEAKQARKRILK